MIITSASGASWNDVPKFTWFKTQLKEPGLSWSVQQLQSERAEKLGNARSSLPSTAITIALPQNSIPQVCVTFLLCLFKHYRFTGQKSDFLDLILRSTMSSCGQKVGAKWNAINIQQLHPIMQSRQIKMPRIEV